MPTTLTRTAERVTGADQLGRPRYHARHNAENRPIWVWDSYGR